MFTERNAYIASLALAGLGFVGCIAAAHGLVSAPVGFAASCAFWIGTLAPGGIAIAAVAKEG